MKVFRVFLFLIITIATVAGVLVGAILWKPGWLREIGGAIIGGIAGVFIGYYAVGLIELLLRAAEAGKRSTRKK